MTQLEHKPTVPADKTIAELTARALIMGAALGIIFAMSSVYLGLKVGLTVSASIPVAVLSITLFRWLGMRGTILENNIAQTTGSAGESLAAGVAFTLPALLLMGFDMELLRVLLVALFGGLIGVLMMIPLRQGLIVKEHGKLAYPEGTACADVLIVGEQGGTSAKTVFTGFFIGLGYAFLNLIAKLWADVSVIPFTLGEKLKKAIIAFEASPPMLGVGYIIGPKVAANMMAGGLLAFVVLIPLIAHFGGPEVAAMSAGQIRNEYVLYIGAGAVATGGFIALARAIPTIIGAFRSGLTNMRSDAKTRAAIPRTERDLPMTLVLGGSAALAIAIFAAPVLDINFLTAFLVVLFGFFFVTVSSRITGEIGSSSNPISGMTIATLLLTCGLFVLLGWTGTPYKAMALTTAALVCVAASNGGTISQDLKTGFLVGATPKLQQIAILVGVITSAVVIGFTLLMLNDSKTTYQAVSHGDAIVQTASMTSERTSGPDGQGYRIAYIRDDQPILPAETVAAGTYLLENGQAKFIKPAAAAEGGAPASFQPVTVARHTFTIHPDLASASATGPDGKPYQVVVLDREVHVPAVLIERGKYLVNDEGRPTFRVDPGVSGSYPYELTKLGQPMPAGMTLRDGKVWMNEREVGAVNGNDLGLDRQPHDVLVLGETVGNLRPGRYLARDGQVAYQVTTIEKFDAPKAQLFRLIIDGTLGGDLPWGLVFIGVILAVILELIGVQSLPFAVGLYLHIATSGGIFIGGIIRWLVDRKRRGESASEAEFSPGMLMASGLIAGGALLGVVQSGLMIGGVDHHLDFSSMLPDVLATNHSWWPLVPFLGMAGALYWVGVKRPASK